MQTVKTNPSGQPGFLLENQRDPGMVFDGEESVSGKKWMRGLVLGARSFYTDILPIQTFILLLTPLFISYF